MHLTLRLDTILFRFKTEKPSALSLIHLLYFQLNAIIIFIDINWLLLLKLVIHIDHKSFLKFINMEYHQDIFVQ